MAGILKVDKYQDFNGNDIMTSDGAGNLTLSSGMNTAIAAGSNNTPAFMVTRSSSQSINNATDTKIQLDTELVDTNSAYDNSTNYRFTVPSGQSGKYLIMWQVRRNNFSSTTLRAIVYINGLATNIATAESYNGSATYASAGNSIILNLSAGDYIELYAYQNSGGAASIYGSGTDKATFFGGYKLIGV